MDCFESGSDQDNWENISKFQSENDRREEEIREGSAARLVQHLRGSHMPTGCCEGCRRGGQKKTARCGRGKPNETERMREAGKPQRNPDVKQTNWDCMSENKASAPRPTHTHTHTLRCYCERTPVIMSHYHESHSISLIENKGNNKCSRCFRELIKHTEKDMWCL